MNKYLKYSIWAIFGLVIIIIAYVLLVRKKQVGITSVNPSITPPTPPTTPGTQAPPVNVGGSNYVIGEKIYAAQDLFYVYKSCDASPTNILQTFANGDLVGTFAGVSGNCAMINIPTFTDYGIFGTDYSGTIIGYIRYK